MALFLKPSQKLVRLPAAAPKAPVRLPTSSSKPAAATPTVSFPAKRPIASSGAGFMGTLNAATAPLRINLAGPPTMSASQAVGVAAGALAGDPGAIDFLSGTHSAAAGGNADAQGDSHLLSLATAVNISAQFVAKWFGQAQADTILAMAHLGS